MLRWLLTTLLFLSWALPGYAAVKTLGQGESLRFDPAGLSPAMKNGNAVLQAKCTLCHSQERIVIAVTTGIAPISGRPFDRVAAAAYGQKMLRKQNSRMTPDEVKAVVDLLTYLVDAAPLKK